VEEVYVGRLEGVECRCYMENHDSGEDGEPGLRVMRQTRWCRRRCWMSICVAVWNGIFLLPRSRDGHGNMPREVFFGGGQV